LRKAPPYPPQSDHCRVVGWVVGSLSKILVWAIHSHFCIVLADELNLGIMERRICPVCKKLFEVQLKILYSSGIVPRQIYNDILLLCDVRTYDLSICQSSSLFYFYSGCHGLFNSLPRKNSNRESVGI